MSPGHWLPRRTTPGPRRPPPTVSIVCRILLHQLDWPSGVELFHEEREIEPSGAAANNYNLHLASDSLAHDTFIFYNVEKSQVKGFNCLARIIPGEGNNPPLASTRPQITRPRLGLALSRLSERPVETRGAKNVARAGALFMKLDLHELCGLVH